MRKRTIKRAPHLELGAIGEELAAAHLRSLGYRILERNIRIFHDEIDIIAFDPADDVLVFGEVKTSMYFSNDFSPLLRADRKKLSILRRCVRRWIATNNYNGGYRIDVIAVADNRVIDHLKQVGVNW